MQYRFETREWWRMINSVQDLMRRGMSVHDAHDMISMASRHLEGIYDACGPAVDANVQVALLNRRLYLLCTEDRIFVTFVPLVHWQTGEHIPMFPTTILELFCTTGKHTLSMISWKLEGRASNTIY